MSGIIFAFLVAITRSARDVISKKGLFTIDEYVLAWIVKLIAFLLLVPLLVFTGIPKLTTTFWISIVLGTIIVSAGTVLYLKALKASDISLTVPLLSLTPLLLLITSPLIVGEFPGRLGLVGVLLIVIGSYTLKIKERHNGFLAPFKALLKEKGPRYMLAVAALWSVGSNIDKLGIQGSSPFFWTVAINAAPAIALLPFVLARRKKLLTLPSQLSYVLPLGILSALGILFQMLAINLTLVVYVISIKRTSMLLSVILGYIFFKEKGLKERLAGATFMLLGVLLIAIS